MDRKPTPIQRISKSKISHHAGDLFALGSKPSSSNKESEVKRSGSVAKSVLNAGSSKVPVSSERKRESTATSLSNVSHAKKVKITAAIAAVRSTGPGGVVPPVAPAPVAEAWEATAMESDPVDLVPSVVYAFDTNQLDIATNLICGAIRTMRSQRWKYDPILCYSLAYLGRVRPALFGQSTVTQALSSLIKRDNGPNKNRGTSVVPVLAANLLARGYNDKKEWPISFIKLYVEDALNERVWVDHEDSRIFVENILTGFNTIKPAPHLLQSDTPSSEIRTPGALDVNSPMFSDDESPDSSPDTLKHPEPNLIVNLRIVPRYTNIEAIESYIVETIKEQISKRATPAEAVTRNALRVMSVACGLIEVRLLAVSRLEMWLHNAKLMRPAQELLAYLCYNCSSKTPKDIEVISQFVKIRLKTKPLSTAYLNCLRVLLQNDAPDLVALMKHTIFNELSNARNPNNIAMVVSMFQEQPERSPNILAEIYKELLITRDDCLRPLRMLLREIVRALRYDINLQAFCGSLVVKDRAYSTTVEAFEFKDRVFASIADLLCLCMFLTVSPQVKDVASSYARGDKKDLCVLQAAQQQVSRIHMEAVRWMEKSVPWMFKPSSPEYTGTMHKILLLEPVDHYVKADNWPPDSERSFILRVASEVPVHQNTLVRIMIIGLQKSCPLAPPDCLELCEQLVRRVSALPSDYGALLELDKTEVLEYLFCLTEYHYPENISLPYGYVPPSLAVAALYWKAWGILLVLAAHNPSTIGGICWEQYPILRALMEMCIINQFVYPPPTLSTSHTYVEQSTNESEIERMERLEIVEFEKHLAAATTQTAITEQNSLLINQLIRYEPMGMSRRPPPQVLDSLRALNVSHRLGHLFCRSREPDFLMDIIQRQGTSQSMPWLADLVQNSEGALSHLPVQCLCEFLLSADVSDQEKHLQLLQHLQGVVMNPNTPQQAACEVLEYFLRRLASQIKQSRLQAVKGLKLLLSAILVDSKSASKPSDWLLLQLPQLPHFDVIRSQVVAALRAACQVETNPDTVVYYLLFLAQHTASNTEDELAELVIDLAQLVVERTLVTNSIVTSELNTEGLNSLLSVFCCYMKKVRVVHVGAYNCLDASDQILVAWSTGETSVMCLNVIHAMFILLSYNPPESTMTAMLLGVWFPANEERPKAFAVDTNEDSTALLYPAWLRLRMLRSPVQCLVAAALQDLGPSELVLFTQSFGIPLESMNKCLLALDLLTVSDEPSVAAAVQDKVYIAQWLEVQRLRGLTSGRVFVERLGLYEPSLTDVPLVLDNNIRPLMDTVKKKKREPKTVQQLLDEIFGEKDISYNLRHNADYYSTVLRLIAVEQRQKKLKKNSVLFEVLQYLKTLSLEDLSSGLVHRSQLMLPLLNLLLSNSSELTKSLLFLILRKAAVNPEIHQGSTPVIEILLRVMGQCGEDSNSKTELSNLTPLQVLKCSPIDEIEHMMKKLIHHETDTVEHKVNLVNALCSLLMENEPTEEATDVSSSLELQIKNSQRYGMLIDWLSAIEPDLIGCSPIVQMQFLFSREAGVKGFRPYLLTLLTHQTSWITLYHCVRRLLSTTHPDYDPTAVLDFLSSLISNPKLWQGRDKFSQRHYTPEDVLDLSFNEICVVLDYILHEALSVYTECTREDTLNRIDARIPLLLNCLGNDHFLVKVIVQYLCNNVANPKVDCTKRQVIGQFLTQFYLMKPIIILYDKCVAVLVNNSDLKGIITSCSMDTLCHSVFTALASTPIAKDWHRRSQELELCARKLSAVHPGLVLRQLPLVAGCLHGRSHLDFGQLRSRYHLALFAHVLGILELLQPTLFRKEHRGGLEDVIGSFFTLFKIHFKSIKELFILLSKFMNLLQSYIHHNPKMALSYIQQHSTILQDLHIAVPQIQLLRNISIGVSLLHQDSETGKPITVGDKQNMCADKLVCLEMGVVAMNTAAPVTEPEPHQWNALVAMLGKVQGDDVYMALQEIDHISNKRPVLLGPMISRLCPALESSASNVRCLAHLLLLRHLKHEPKARATSDICKLQLESVHSKLTGFKGLMQCLGSSEPDVTTAALERIQEYVICFQENALLILQELFTLGVKSKINTTPHIAKCITILKLQEGN